MKKRPFLAPALVSFAALIASPVSASQPPAVEATASPTQVELEAHPPVSSFVLERSDSPGIKLAGHSSHASHASHASHSSHYSSS
jgi:hypothetical protein